MRVHHWRLLIAILLTCLSALLCLGHFLVFRDANTLFFYLALDFAFVPVQVLFVSFVLDKLTSSRENRTLRKKLDTVVGAFYSEAGRKLLAELARFHPEPAAARAELEPDPAYCVKDFRTAAARLAASDSRLGAARAPLEPLAAFLDAKRAFCLRVLDNHNLLEHERFTDLLWALTHLSDELSARPSLQNLPPTDLDHLSGDLTRLYRLLSAQWMEQLCYLKTEYPFLYSLAVRTNPLDPAASAVVRE